MKNIKEENPLKSIFVQQKDGTKFFASIKSLKNINNFFIYLKEPKNSEESKCKTIEEIIKLIKDYRGISVYFSSHENESIYIFLFNLYLNPKTGINLQRSLINLIKVLILSIELSKNIFYYIFQKISFINTNLKTDSKNLVEDLTKCLTLLNSLISPEIENKQKPYNYFICNGEGNLNINISSFNLTLGFSITFILNFKIWNMISLSNKETTNIIKINFISGKSISIDLDNNCNLVMKEMKNKSLKKLVYNEYMNLVITISGNEKKINFYFLLNGENQLNNPIKYQNNEITSKDEIDNVQFFNNFFGEVSTISMISQNKDFESSSLLPIDFLGELKSYKDGLWKRKYVKKFLELFNKINSKRKNKLKLIFIFTPKNLTQEKNCENIVESINSNLFLKFSGNIRCHNYECYQKKLFLLNAISNILPIAEMFVVHPTSLNSTNFEIFLEIIINILSHNKKNMLNFIECKFFQMLSLFLEKYPNNIFSEKILELFFEMGKYIFPSKYEKLNSNYFHHILLNEKIISKYSEDLQIKFWNNLLKFTQSDKYQIANYINMNKLSLILRFYDRNKYTEMCCKKHLSMIKPEYVGNTEVMNPEMPKKLSYLENILTSIIYSKEAKNACSLFKLLILDLSPCLNLFIINIFIKTFQKTIKTVKWKDQLIMELINAKYEVIIVNAFIHGLPEIKIEILKLMNEIHQRLLVINKGNYFTPFENMIKTCFLPQNMFYEKNNLIFKDELLVEYKEILFNILYLWTIGLKLDEDIKKINFAKNLIKNPNIILLLFALIKELNDINYTLKSLDIMQLLISNPQNAYTIFSNKAISLKFLTFNFNYYKSEDKKLLQCFNKSKSIILDIFINSLLYMEKNTVINPSSELYMIFIWMKNILEEKNNFDKNKEKLMYDFLSEFFFEILTLFKIKFDPKMVFNLKDPKFSPGNNYYLKNYFYLMTSLFEFGFLLKSPETKAEIEPSKSINSELKKYINSMRLNNSKIEKVSVKWLDFQFFDDLYKRFNIFWGIKSTLQKLFKSKTKGNKVLRYEEILKESILDKDNKNTYLKKLELLCFQEKDNKKNNNIIIAPIDIISISMMCITSLAKEEKDIKYWLKELKYFMLFLIISSSNLVKNNIYNSIQEKIICILSSTICFLNDLMNKYNSNNNKVCYEKAKKNLQKILSFCLIVTHYQSKFSLEHKNKLNILKILNINQNNQNDLSSSAVYILFSEYIKDNKTNTSILTKEKLDQLALSQYVTVVEHFNKQEMIEAFFENQKLKNKLDNMLFNYEGLKKYFNERNNKNKENKTFIEAEYDYKYKNEILDLLPKYEKELKKHSNNLLEKNIKYKNMYKYSKKKSFSWLGLWTDKKLFFENNEKLKQKIINHVTKNLMRPIIAPILDMSYYLPEFSGFNRNNLFNTKKPGYSLHLDIDKILKNSEQNKKKGNNNIITKKNSKENYLREIYQKSNPELAKGFLKLANHLDFGKEEEFFFIENNSENTDNNKSKKKKYFLCCLVKPSHHIKGVIFINENKLDFKVFLNQKTGNVMSDVEIGFTNKDDDYDEERQTCFGSYFICHPKDKDLYKISIKYNDIDLIFRRRYYYKNSGLEIYTNTNKCFYFNFKYEEDRETTINEILLKLKDCTKIINDMKTQKDIFDNIIGYDNSINFRNKKIKKVKISKKVELWKEWQISNFELIMWLNIFSNRSYNDLSQYPVFPWLITDYEDPINLEPSTEEENNNIEQIYRDLSLPMGMLTINELAKNRKELFIKNYKSSCKDADMPFPYMYGSNYSNPTYVCNYLVRIFPFTHISIELQGDKFDDPNRLFNEVKLSFKSATTQKADVRELIPEFFFFPEMFINLNDLNMGIRDNGKKVNDVSTPCSNNPYEFTLLMRNVLENDIISNNINKWIDLIFGYKNKGEEAEENYNVFTESSYQEDIDLKKVENKDLYLRFAEFGLIPNQIISKEFEKRNKKEEIIKGIEITDPKASLKNYEITSQNNNENNNFEEVVILSQIFSEGKISMLMNNFTYIEKKINFSIFDKTYTNETINYIKLKDEEDNKINNIMSEFYSEDSYNNKCIKFYNSGKSIIMGGFYDGKLLVFSIEKVNKLITELYPFLEEKPILSVEIDSEEVYLFLGNSIGNVCIYQINQDISQWKKLYLKTEHFNKISHIHCNNELNLWCSTSINGYINLYTLPLCKLIRTIKVQTKKCSYSFISSSPLPILIIINDEENNSELYVYSINGKFILKHQEYIHINNPIIIKDIYSFEYLAFSNKNNIIIKKLPNLDIVVNIDCEEDVYSFCFSNDNKNIFAFDKNGKKIYLIKG